MILHEKHTARPVPIEVRNQIVIPAPAEPVWDLLTNMEAWPSWHRACRWVRIEPAVGGQRSASFRWKAHPIELQSTVVTHDRPHRFGFTADGLGLHALHTFTLRPSAEGLRTVVESHETQVGWLPWLGRFVLAPRLDAANQAWLADLARTAALRAAMQATVTVRCIPNVPVG